MVEALRQGASQRAVAREFRVSLLTVQRWAARAGDLPLDEVDWSDRPAGPHQAPKRTIQEIEDMVLRIRQELRKESDLGEYGGQAIRGELEARQVDPVPAVSTIYRILERRGALDGQRRPRRRPPPRGWYLPDVAAGRAELDQFDFIEDLRIQGGPLVDVLTVVSLHGGLVGAWPRAGFSAQNVVECLVEHWRAFGAPTYAQFDNDTRFQGPHQHPGAIGRVIRLCLGLGIVPVFVPVAEQGFQAAIEGYNGLWQAKVWARFHHQSLEALRDRSARYVAAHHHRTRARREGAPARHPFPEPWTLNLQAPLHGRIIFVRRTSAQGKVTLLGSEFTVADTWPNRLVRCEVALDDGVLRFYALRRREPTEQPLLSQVRYELPKRRFRV